MLATCAAICQVVGLDAGGVEGVEISYALYGVIATGLSYADRDALGATGIVGVSVGIVMAGEGIAH